MGATSSRIVVATLLVAFGGVLALRVSTEGVRSEAKPHVRRVAFAGNSLLYYNDVPRLLAEMHGSELEHECCLRGGASLTTLYEQGRRNPFHPPNGSPTVESLLADAWDVVVLQDYTQAPARAASRDESVAALVEKYAPLLVRSGGTPILLETHAYREVTKGSDDLGSVEEFTAALCDGCALHARAASWPRSQGVRARVRACAHTCEDLGHGTDPLQCLASRAPPSHCAMRHGVPHGALRAARAVAPPLPRGRLSPVAKRFVPRGGSTPRRHLRSPAAVFRRPPRAHRLTLARCALHGSAQAPGAADADARRGGLPTRRGGEGDACPACVGSAALR
jgi:hypothetical protein